MSSFVESSFWQSYTSDGSMIPFIFPTVLWTSLWIYVRFVKRGYFLQWQAIHALHNNGAILHGIVSLYYNDDRIFNERIAIIWSIPYFVVDIIECMIVQNYAYLLHGLLVLTGCLGSYYIPSAFTLRLYSKGTFMEASSVFLHQAKKTRDPAMFLMFGIVFTLCRIIWIPIFTYDLYENGFGPTDTMMLVLYAFYGLQVYWWIKIIRILLKGKGKDTESDNDTSKKTNTMKTTTTTTTTSTSTTKRKD